MGCVFFCLAAAEQLAEELKEGQPLLESIDWAAALDTLRQISPESIKTFFEAQLAESGGKPTPALVGVGKETLFLRRFYIKCIILPRQARDKHRENSKKSGVFLGKRMRWMKAQGGTKVMRKTKRATVLATYLLLI